MLTNLNKKHTPFSVYWTFFKSKWYIYILGVCSIAVTSSMQVYVPRLMGHAVDLLSNHPIPNYLNTDGSKLETYKKLFLFFVLANIVLMLGRVSWRLTFARLTPKAGAYLRKKIWKKAVYFSQDKIDKEISIGELMNISTSDVNAARFIFGFTLVSTFDIIFLLTFSTITLYSINPEITFYVLLTLSIIPILLYQLAKQESTKFNVSQDFLSKFNDLCSQVVSTIRLQRLTSTGFFWIKKLYDSAASYREKWLEVANTSIKYYPIMGVATMLCNVVLFVFGIYKVFKNEITIGEFVVIQSCIYVLQDPIMELGFIISEWQKGLTSLRRLTDIYNEPIDENMNLEGKTIKENIKTVYELTNVNYTYDNNLKILKNFNLSVDKGKRVGILGPIGTGKSTLMKILSGLDTSTIRMNGSIKIFNQSIKECDHYELRKLIAVVPQKTFLFADTIANNISMNSELSEVEILHYLDLACIKEEVLNMVHGIHTPLGEGGINLSGGQKQRITLARALSKKPKILLLDDCLSAVDTITEERILQKIDHHLKNTTIIWVAHRKSTLKYCHEILEFQL